MKLYHEIFNSSNMFTISMLKKTEAAFGGRPIDLFDAGKNGFSFSKAFEIMTKETIIHSIIASPIEQRTKYEITIIGRAVPDAKVDWDSDLLTVFKSLFSAFDSKTIMSLSLNNYNNIIVNYCYTEFYPNEDIDPTSKETKVYWDSELLINHSTILTKNKHTMLVCDIMFNNNPHYVIKNIICLVRSTYMHLASFYGFPFHYDGHYTTPDGKRYVDVDFRWIIKKRPYTSEDEDLMSQIMFDTHGLAD